MTTVLKLNGKKVPDKYAKKFSQVRKDVDMILSGIDVRICLDVLSSTFIKLAISKEISKKYFLDNVEKVFDLYKEQYDKAQDL